MVARQPSDAPERLGMREQVPSTISYYADEDDKAAIKEELDKRYDLLGVPAGARLYRLTSDEAYQNWKKENLDPLVWEEVKEDEAPQEASKFWTPKEGYVLIEKSREKAIASADIYLALAILTDIEEQGYCSLEAEV